MTSTRRTTPNGAVRQVVWVSITGMCLLAWGAIIAIDSPLWSGPLDCESSNLPSPPGLLWLMWLLMASLASAAVVVHRQRCNGHRTSAWLAGLGVVSTLLTFPGFLAMGAGMSCGL